MLWRVFRGSDRFWLKQHEAKLLYERELSALSRCAAHLDGVTVPTIVHRDDELGVMLLTNVSGSHPDEMELSLDESTEMHRLAGAAVRSLHELPLGDPPDAPYSDHFIASMERALALSQPHLDTGTIDWIRRAADGGAAFEGSAYVNAHMDYSRRNWLVERSGSGLRLGVIDWERTRADHWLQDAQRMVPDDWEREPALRTAFFQGYGRDLDEQATRQLDLLVLLGAVGAIWWSADHGDAAFEAYGHDLVARMRGRMN